MEAFRYLSDARPLVGGMTVLRGNIPISEMRAYWAADASLSHRDWPRFVYLIQCLDAVFMKHQAEEIKRQESQRSTSPRRGK